MQTELGSTAPNEMELLRRAGLRMTPQRLAIARELVSQSHPSAGQIYEALRSQYPTMGLATVYATLRTMQECGLVHELPFADGVRYDANLTPHVNLVCTRCRRIIDGAGYDDLLALLRERAAGTCAFDLQTQRVDLYGICRDCQESAQQPQR